MYLFLYFLDNRIKSSLLLGMKIRLILQDVKIFNGKILLYKIKTKAQIKIKLNNINSKNIQTDNKTNYLKKKDKPNILQ